MVKGIASLAAFNSSTFMLDFLASWDHAPPLCPWYDAPNPGLMHSNLLFVPGEKLKDSIVQKEILYPLMQLRRFLFCETQLPF